MRALVVIGLGCLGLVAASACVPDFAYRDGIDGSGGAGNGDGDGGDRPSRGGGGGKGPGVVAVGVGPGGGPSGPGPGPGPGPSTTGSTTTTTGVTGAGGQGDGGAATATTSTTSGDTTTSSSTGGTLIDDGAPCWNGFLQQVDACTDGEVCCYDADYYSYHECDTAGFCSDYAYELQCNDAGDCDPGELCCVNVDGFGDLQSITCETSCPDLHACSSQQPCPGGLTCYYVFDPDSGHDEYDAYGFCYEG